MGESDTLVVDPAVTLPGGGEQVDVSRHVALFLCRDYHGCCHLQTSAFGLEIRRPTGVSSIFMSSIAGSVAARWT